MKLFTTALVFGFLAVMCGCDQKTQQPVSTKEAHGAAAKTYFLYIKIPEQLMPEERGKKYEDPINELLSANAGGASRLQSGVSGPAWVRSSLAL